MPFLTFRDTELEDANDVQGDNPLPVTLAPPGGALVHPTIAVGGDMVQATASFLRPADSTQYAIADAVANSTTAGNVVPLVFGTMAVRPGGSGYVTAALLKMVVATATVTSGSFRLHLFTAVPATLWADNAALNLLYADTAGYVGSLDVTVQSEGGSATLAYAIDDSRRLPYACAANDTRLFGLMAAEATYTPTSGQAFAWTLTAERNG